MDLIDWATGALVGIPATMGLAAVALIGYMVGRRSCNVPARSLPSVGPRELHRAARVARQLEDTVEEVRQQLAEHRTYIGRFKAKVDELEHYDPRAALDLLAAEAEQVIVPTLRLASRLSHAYDELRQQSQVLSNFTEGRTDPTTGLGNLPALEEQLQLALGDRLRAAIGVHSVISARRRGAQAVLYTVMNRHCLTHTAVVHRPSNICSRRCRCA